MEFIGVRTCLFIIVWLTYLKSPSDSVASPNPKNKKKIKIAGWATGLSAGETDWALEFSFFKVVIDLTDVGHG
jgi:hypothetical protein